MSKKIMLGIMWFFSVIFILMGVSIISQTIFISGILFLLFGLLLLPPILNRLEIIGKKPTKSKRAIAGIILLFFAVLFMPITDNQQQSNIDSNYIESTTTQESDNFSLSNDVVVVTNNNSTTSEPGPSQPAATAAPTPTVTLAATLAPTASIEPTATAKHTQKVTPTDAPTPTPEQGIEVTDTKEITVYVTNTGSNYHVACVIVTPRAQIRRVFADSTLHGG